MERPASSTLPTTPGIYIYKDAQGRIIYVGKARNLRKRILSYFRDASALTPKTVAMIGHAASLETLSTTTEKEALLLEASLIKKHRPHYNIVLRDDKQYVLFRIAKDAPYPRLEVVRQARRDNARYFGPFTSGQAARETWKTIHRVFPLRRCVDRAFKNRVRPCLYHHIGQCLAPCTENVPVEEYASLIHRVELLLSGRSRELLDTLRHAMADASEAMNYEQAAVFRDQIKAIERTVERQSVVLPEGGNMDVAGVAPAKGGLALGLLFVREGRLVDGRTFFWPDLELAEGPELLWSFLGQFYGPQTSIPPRIVVPWLPEDTVLPGMSGEQDAQDSASPAKDHIATLEGEAEPPHATGTDSNGHAPDEVESLEALEAALADARGGIVRIAKPRNAAEARLVDMAVSNAREAAVTKSEVPMSDRLAAAFALDKVQSALPGAVPMASRPIRRIECVDVSHTGGTSTRVTGSPRNPITAPMPLKAKRPATATTTPPLPSGCAAASNPGLRGRIWCSSTAGAGRFPPCSASSGNPMPKGCSCWRASPRPATTWGAPTAGPGTWATGFSCPAGAIHCRCATVPPSYCFSSISAIRRTISSSGGTAGRGRARRFPPNCSASPA